MQYKWIVRSSISNVLKSDFSTFFGEETFVLSETLNCLTRESRVRINPEILSTDRTHQLMETLTHNLELCNLTCT